MFLNGDPATNLLFVECSVVCQVGLLLPVKLQLVLQVFTEVHDHVGLVGLENVAHEVVHLVFRVLGVVEGEHSAEACVLLQLHRAQQFFDCFLRLSVSILLTIVANECLSISYTLGIKSVEDKLHLVGLGVLEAAHDLQVLLLVQILHIILQLNLSALEVGLVGAQFLERANQKLLREFFDIGREPAVQGKTFDSLCGTHNNHHVVFGIHGRRRNANRKENALVDLLGQFKELG